MTSQIEQDDQQRQQHIPYLFVRGTHYEVGYSIGKTFRSLIEDFFEDYHGFKEDTLPAYKSESGKRIFNGCLKICTERFPQYVQELQGMAAGARIPFDNLFLLHIEDLVAPFDPSDADIQNGNVKLEDLGCKGCSSVIFTSKSHLLLGHTEDALREMTNTFYVISVEILTEDGTTITEKFTSLVYPGQLPGGTMGFNDHGIIHSVNSIFPVATFPTRTPHLFLTRAALAAKSLNELIEIFRDDGNGTGNGFSMNLIISNELSDSGRAYNVEVCPNECEKTAASEIFVNEIPLEECYSHCNSYLKCTHPEKGWYVSSSVERQKMIQNFVPPFDMDKMKEILSVEVPDGEDKVKYSIFKRALYPDDHYATLVAGIFDIAAKQWCLYKRSPAFSEPTAVIPISFHRKF